MFIAYTSLRCVLFKLFLMQTAFNAVYLFPNSVVDVPCSVCLFPAKMPQFTLATILVALHRVYVLRTKWQS